MRSIWAWGLGLACLSAACGCGGGGGGTDTTAWDGAGTTLPATDSYVLIDHRHAYAAAALIPDADMTAARSKEVVFGHQSVGANILAGLAELSTYDSRYEVHVQSYPYTLTDVNVVEFSVGSNGDPQGKIDDFVDKMMDTGVSLPHDILAMFKFCYVDFDDSTDATALFNSYRSAMEGLETGLPDRRFVYCTAPLTTDYLASRQEFNVLVRNYCQTNGKPLFDIASIESHTPADAAVGGSQPVLYSGYTTDGGHLNTTGQLRVARAWWWLVARLSGWNGT